MSSDKIIKKSLPCSFYDIQGIHSWLDEMALQGLFLHHLSYHGDRAYFTQGEPRPVRYRLDPSLKHIDAAERKENYAQMGWQFIAAVPSGFSIFSCDDPSAPELYSDPETMGYALSKLLRRKSWTNILGGLVLLFLLGLLFYLGREDIVRNLIFGEQPFELLYFSVYLLFAVFCLTLSALELRYMRTACRTLEQGLPLKAGRRWRWRPTFLLIYFAIYVPLLLFSTCARYITTVEVCGLDEASLSHPWPTIGQLEGTGPHPLESEPEVDGYLELNHSWLVPVQEYASIDWKASTFHPETGEVTYLDRPYSLWLEIGYDRARSPWAARQAYQLQLERKTKELKKALTYHHEYRVAGLQEFQSMEYPGLDRLETVRFRRAGQDAWLFAALRGNEVLMVQYAGFASLEDCLPLFLEALDQPSAEKGA